MDDRIRSISSGAGNLSPLALEEKSGSFRRGFFLGFERAQNRVMERFLIATGAFLGSLFFQGKRVSIDNC